jgi:hypothetical protein
MWIVTARIAANPSYAATGATPVEVSSNGS